MNPFEALKTILESQQIKGVKSKDWDKLDYEISKDEPEKDIQIDIPSLKVVFVFQIRSKQLIGAYNYKQ